MSKQRKLPEYTDEQVYEHNKEGDCWISIHGKVYNVSDFMDEHPGGPETLLNVAGQDSTEEFDDIFHSDNAKQMMAKYLVGKLKGYESGAGSSGGAAYKKQKQSNGMLYLLPVILFAAVIYYQMFMAN